VRRIVLGIVGRVHVDHPPRTHPAHLDYGGSIRFDVPLARANLYFSVQEAEYESHFMSARAAVTGSVPPWGHIGGSGTDPSDDFINAQIAGFVK